MTLILTNSAPTGSGKLFRLGPVPEGAPIPLVRVYESGHAEVIEHQSAAEVQSIIDYASGIRERNNWFQHRRPEEGEPKGMISAHFPVTLCAMWRRLWRERYRGEMGFIEFLIKMLNSREYRKFNTHPSGTIPLYSQQVRR